MHSFKLLIGFVVGYVPSLLLLIGVLLGLEDMAGRNFAWVRGPWLFVPPVLGGLIGAHLVGGMSFGEHHGARDGPRLGRAIGILLFKSWILVMAFVALFLGPIGPDAREGMLMNGAKLLILGVALLGLAHYLFKDLIARAWRAWRRWRGREPTTPSTANPTTNKETA